MGSLFQAVNQDKPFTNDIRFIFEVRWEFMKGFILGRKFGVQGDITVVAIVVQVDSDDGGVGRQREWESHGDDELASDM